MKKKLSLLFLTMLAMLFMLSCRNNNDDDIKFYIPDNIQTLAVANMLDEGLTYNGKTVEFIFESESKIEKYLNNNTFTLALCNTTTAALSHKSNHKVKIVFNTSYSSSYIVTNGKKFSSLSNLIGNTIYVKKGFYSKLLQYELKNNDISYTLEEGNDYVADVYIKQVSDENEIITAFANNTDNSAIAFINEPYLTKLNHLCEIKICMDAQSEYKKLNDSNSYFETSLVVKNSFAEENEEFLTLLQEKFLEITKYLKNNNETLNTLFYNLGTSNLASISYDLSTIERANIYITKSWQHKENISKFIETFTNIKPDDDFYYEF